MCKYAQVCATRLCIINCDKGEAKNLRRDVSMSEILAAKELADQLKVKPETVRRCTSPACALWSYRPYQGSSKNASEGSDFGAESKNSGNEGIGTGGSRL